VLFLQAVPLTQIDIEAIEASSWNDVVGLGFSAVGTDIFDYDRS